MEEKTGFPKEFSAVIIGAGAGVIMSLIVIHGLRAEGYQMWTLSFWLIAVIASILPACLDWLTKKDILPIIAEPVMIATSFVLTLMYGYTSASNETALILLRNGACIVHGISALVLIFRILVEKWIERKENA